MSRADIVVDWSEKVDRPATMEVGQLLDMRAQAQAPALLLLYPIDKDSPPAHTQHGAHKTPRVPLSAKTTVVGVALIFPLSSAPTTVTYMTAPFHLRLDVEDRNTRY